MRHHALADDKRRLTGSLTVVGLLAVNLDADVTCLLLLPRASLLLLPQPVLLRQLLLAQMVDDAGAVRVADDVDRRPDAIAERRKMGVLIDIGSVSISFFQCWRALTKQRGIIFHQPCDDI